MAKLLFEWDYSSYPGAKAYPHLFKQIQMGNLIVPNRNKVCGHRGQFERPQWFYDGCRCCLYKRRAEGVVGGLCFMQGVYMDEARKGQGYVGQAACWDDKYIQGLRGSPMRFMRKRPLPVSS